jgi:hypothetical protein
MLILARHGLADFCKLFLRGVYALGIEVTSKWSTFN